MKIFPTYPGFHKVQSALAEYFWSLKKGRMWCYNILGDIEGSISHIVWIYNITAGSVLLTAELIVLIGGNTEAILTVEELNGENSLIILVKLLRPTHRRW